ncbi:MAG: phenylacetate--CoA ligase family protein [Methyloligellaceae bacterium]
MSAFFDDLETRAPEQREASLFERLPGLIQLAQERAPAWRHHLEGIDPAAVTSRTALAALPVLRKPDLLRLQGEAPPFGGFTATAVNDLGRLYLSPGPIYEPEGVDTDWWRTARAVHAAGFRAGDIAINTFAYHLTPGGWMIDAGLRNVGCTVIPAGPGNTEQQVAAIAHLKPVGYTGVPDFLKILLDKAEELGADASSIVKALVSGGALFPSLRQEYADRGISVLQAYATADLGVIAYESEAMEGMIVDEGLIVEIARPGTDEPVPEGEVGELVVTNLNEDYPMIRFGTGDLSAVLPGPSPCGRTNMRIKGWLGRADQRTKVKGMFVDPQQVDAVAKRHPELGRLRLVVSRQGEQDAMTLMAESDAPDAATDQIAETLLAVTKLKGAVEIVAAGSLPNDGKVIADERSYD